MLDLTTKGIERLEYVGLDEKGHVVALFEGLVFDGEGMRWECSASSTGITPEELGGYTLRDQFHFFTSTERKNLGL